MNERPSTLYGSNLSSQKKSMVTRQEIGRIEASSEESYKHHIEAVKAKYEKYGTGKLTPEGTIARLSGVPYPDLNKVNEGNAKSFYYGYYERGNTNIRILIETGQTSIPILTDNIMKVYQEINKAFGLNKEEMSYEQLDEKTKYNETLRVIGFNDGKNPEINFDNLNEVIRNCIPYKEGFELGKTIRENNECKRTTLKGNRR